MAVSSPCPRVNQPVRSISLPSRLESSGTIEEVLKNLKSFQISSQPTRVPLGAEAIQAGLVGLAELYHCVEELLQSQITQRALLQYQQGKLVEEALNGSVTLLDSCSTARDILLQLKDHVQILQSALRRRGGDLSIEQDIHSYFCFRKRARKEVSKTLEALNKLESKSGSPMLDPSHDLSFILRLLSEARGITISTFRAILVYLSTPLPRCKNGKWFLVTQLMIPMRMSSSEKGQKIINEMETVDAALQSLHGQVRTNGCRNNAQMAQKMLAKLSICTEGFESPLDCLFRCIVQHRVSFLNCLCKS